MSKLWEMLDKAYEHIGENSYEEARNVLEQVLFNDPQNVDAWAAYIHICNTERDLKQLRDYIINTWKTRVHNDYLLATKRFVLQRLEEKMSSL
jgi:Tfp pilus assembly protein PilF